MRDDRLIVALDYQIEVRLRYSTDPDLGLTEFSRRADVRRVRALIPRVQGIGKVRLAEIDRWLAEAVCA